MAKLLCLVLFSLFSTSLCSTSSPNTTRCLNTLAEIKRHLSSNIPPIDGWITDNYSNISRALFPVFNVPSLYIKITIQFINSSGELDNKFEKFTWSKSPIFVSVQELSLTAMSIFSLGTILPQRRQTELVLTVPRLCENSGKKNSFKDNNEVWKYILSALEDIVILPNSSDPRVNTALMVILGHEGDEGFAKSLAHWNIYKCYLIIAASLLLTIALYWYVNNGIKEDSNPFKQTMFLSVLIFSVFITISLIASFIICIIGKNVLFGVLHYLIICFIGTIICGVIIYNLKEKKERQRNVGEERQKIYTKRWLFIKLLMFPCLYQCIHHLLWVLCGGIPSDPSWAIPLFLCECLAMIILVYAIDIGCQSNNCDCYVVVQLIVSVVAFWLVITIVVFSFYQSVAMSTENILEIAVAAVLGWMIKNSSFSVDLGRGVDNGHIEIPLHDRG